MSDQNHVKYVPAGTGPMYCGPADRVSFLATGAETHGSCFIIEGLVAPGGGPPPHIHHFEDESFYEHGIRPSNLVSCPGNRIGCRYE